MKDTALFSIDISELTTDETTYKDTKSNSISQFALPNKTVLEWLIIF